VVAGRVLVLGRTPTESKSLGELLAQLARRVPSLRISLTVSRAGDEIDRLLAWGVEVSVVAPDELAAWSGQRTLHYDLIFATDAELAKQVVRSQSIASVHLLPLTPGGITDIMESAGLGERDNRRCPVVV
jgi:hypothetical protein